MSAPLVWGVLGTVALAAAAQYLFDPIAATQLVQAPVWALATSAALGNALVRWLAPLLHWP